MSVLYGCLLAALLFLLKWLQLRFWVVDHSIEVYVGTVALLFMGLGIWLARSLITPKVHTVVVEKTISVDPNFEVNHAEIERLSITPRELEVLKHMAEGLSNQEIADRMFVSISTIKTHSKNLFDKMQVSRRTQAIEQARRSRIIA